MTFSTTYLKSTLQLLAAIFFLSMADTAIAQSCPCGNNVNLFTNGDFESGELGPSNTEMSEWNVNCNEVFGCYNIVASASESGGQFNGAPHGGNQFMFVDGQDASPGNAPQLVWSQTVDCLIPGQNYNFRFWLVGCSGFGDIFVLDANVTANGITTWLNPNTLINTFMPNPNTPLAWLQYSFNWTATASAATFSLDQISFASSGFDFGLDDIRLIGNSGATLECTATATDISCSGEAGDLNIQPQNGNPPYQISINSPSGVITNITSSESTHFEVTETGEYVINITDSGNCTVEISTSVAQDDKLTANLIITDPTCTTNGQVELVPTNGTSPFELTVNNAVQPSLDFETSDGEYDIHLEDANGCSLDSVMNIQPDNPVNAFFSFNNSENTITLENLSTGANEFQWYFNGILISTESIPSETILLQVNSTLELISTDSISGCSDAYSIDLIPNGNIFDIYIPNCITADNDGVNDVLFIFGDESKIKQFACKIFDRWGQEVFSSDSMEKPWIANAFGGSYYVPDGVYNYRIQYQLFSDSQMYEKAGHITVIR